MVKFMKSAVAISLIFVAASAISGCAGTEVKSSNQAVSSKHAEVVAKEKVIMDSFNLLIQQKDVPVHQLVKFIDDNIGAVSRPDVSTMVVELEKRQREHLPKLEGRFIAEEQAVQKALAKEYIKDMSETYISDISSKEVRELLLEAKRSGYKIETAEGMYFPVIDYSFYNKYRNNVTPDISAYLGIMAVETEKTPVKDAALTISWSEVLKRAAVQEQFIREYGTSSKVPEMKQTLKRYVSFALYGTNNTPLFRYENGHMVNEAKKAYLEASFTGSNGAFSRIMINYLELLHKNDYRITDQVQQYRNKAIAEM